MNDMIFDNYQNLVNDCLIRHNNILDILTKFSETNARVNRAVVKSINNCKCISIDSNNTVNKTAYKPCENCRNTIEKEIGNNLFYLASLCNVLDINLYDVIIDEYNNMNLLGKFSIH